MWWTRSKSYWRQVGDTVAVSLLLVGAALLLLHLKLLPEPHTFWR